MAWDDTKVDSSDVLYAADYNTLVTNVKAKVAHSLATAANDFLVASGSGTFVKKTLAEVLVILAHASSHASGAADAIKLDDLATPDDNTDLDVSASRHGLCPKLPGTTTTFLRGDGTFTTPASDWWFSISSGYTATPASTSTLTMTSDLTGTLQAGYGLKYTIGGTVYYGMITAITSTLMTIAGAPLSGDVSNLYYTKTGMIQMPILIPGYYEDANDTALIASDLGQTIRWQQGKAYLVNVQSKTRVADGSSNGTINARVAGSDVLSTALTLASTSWVASVVAVTVANYDINYGEEVELNAVKGTGGDAQDLSMVLTFVVA